MTAQEKRAGIVAIVAILLAHIVTGLIDPCDGNYCPQTTITR